MALGHFGDEAAYTGRTMLEFEADREAVRLLNKAGYDVSRAPDILRRLSHKYRGHDRHAASHPSFSERWHRVSSQIRNLSEPKQAMND